MKRIPCAGPRKRPARASRPVKTKQQAGTAENKTSQGVGPAKTVTRSSGRGDAVPRVGPLIFCRQKAADGSQRGGRLLGRGMIHLKKEGRKPPSGPFSVPHPTCGSSAREDLPAAATLPSSRSGKVSPPPIGESEH